MKQDELDLLHGYLDGSISDVDFAELQSLLRESPEARRTLRALATVDAKLQELGALRERTVELVGMPPLPSPARSRFDFPAWSSVAAAAACVALALTVMLSTHVKPVRPRPDLTAAFSSTQGAIARLSIAPPSLLPTWASPTASMLNQPRIPE